jgi:hypothetical protein
MTDYRRSSTIPFLTILLLAFSAALSAAPVDSRITSVTVYADRAIVTRTATNELTAGEHTLTFENLPAAIVDQSLQASGFGCLSHHPDVSAQNVFAETTTNEHVKSVEDQIETCRSSAVCWMIEARYSKNNGRSFNACCRLPRILLLHLPQRVARPTLDEWQKLFRIPKCRWER